MFPVVYVNNNPIPPNNINYPKASPLKQNDKKNNNIKFFYANCRSIRNKKDELFGLISQENPEIIGLTETWVQCEKNDFISEYNIKGYSLFHKDRKSKKGGGVMLYIKNDLKPLQINYNKNYACNETVWAELKLSNGGKLRVGVVYRPPIYNLPQNANLENKLYEELRYFTQDDTNSILLGDFNLPKINWDTNDPGDEYGKNMIDLIHDNFLYQHIDEKTRDNNILDLVITSEQNLINYCEVGEHLSNCDHNIIRGCVNKSFNTDVSSQKIPNFDKANFDNIRKFLCETDWDTLLHDKNASEMFSVLKGILHECTDRFIPFKNRRLQGRNKPRWMSRDLKHLITRKRKLYKAYKRTKNNAILNEYRAIIRETKKKTKMDKKAFEKVLSENCKNNPKEFFSYVREQRKTKDTIGPLRDRDTNVTLGEDCDMANLLNKQFSSVFNQVSDNMMIPNAELVSNNGIPHLVDLTITESEVIKQIEGIKVCKTPGPDKIYPRFLKETKHELAGIFASIFNKSIKSGVVPEDWRMANVTPIFKKGDKRDPANYRPISLTSIVGKILETLIRNKIVEYLELNNFIKNSQHGFRKNRSCLTNLLEFFDVVYKNVADSKPYDVIYLDFEKAFDKVPHKHLIRKVEALGIKDNISKWIKSWLDDRSQRVVINGKESEWSQVTSGVPQGSVLGPLLFTIYINDIDENIVSQISKFADDTKIGGICRDESDHGLIQSDLNRLFEWSQKWLMSFNINKCKVMHLGGNAKTPRFKYFINGIELEVVKEEKDLGVLISNNLKSSAHCDSVVKKANKMLGLIKRSFTYKDEQTILKLYKALVRPHLEYAQQFWSPHLKKDVDKLEKVQKRATKIVPTLRNLSYENRLKKTELFSLEKRRLRGDLIEMYKIITNISPLNFDDYFEYCQNGLRGNSLKLSEKFVKNTQYRKYFFKRIPKIWNSLSTDTVTSSSLSRFKANLDLDLRRII